ncbi:MAG: hypothetical protein LBQ84_04205, partial [Flavobacteriaceae bacterium]|nr:hypothetical protein [Flavobacteriaceae bacterium]
MRVLKNIRYNLFFIIIVCLGNSFLFAQENGEEQSLTLDDPVKYEAYYDYKTGNYILYPKIGGIVVGILVTMT